MTISRVKYYYFSPTNTTKKVVEKIARGIGKDIIEENITFIEKNSKEYVSGGSPCARNSTLASCNWANSSWLIVISPIFFSRSHS